MSKTKSTNKVPKAEKVEKKRKRQEEETDDVPKKSKKSKKSEDDQDAAPSDKPIAEQTAVEKEGSNEEKPKTRKERRAEEAAVEKARKKAEKKAKKAEKLEAAKTEDKAESAQATEAATPIQTNGAVQSEAEDFIAFPDEVLMPDATEVAELEERKRKKEETRKLKKVERVKAKKEKKSKRAEKLKDTSEADIVPSEDAIPSTQNGVAEETVAETNGVDVDDKAARKEAKKAKKEKKVKKSKPETNGEAVNGEDVAVEQPADTNGDGTAEEQNVEDGDENAEPGKKGRFIVFVGNLPYTATKESIAEHFVKVHPIDIRLRTYKGSEKFMGTCFLEFDRFDRMETCLKKYHHSVFADGKKKDGRKINVELSAGGGGNSEVRKSRIVAKNDKLADERVRDREKRAEVEAKQGERKQKKDAKSKKGEVNGAAEEEGDEPEAGMHPARLAMMQQPARPTHRQRF